jgi:hypothetical protein
MHPYDIQNLVILLLFIMLVAALPPTDKPDAPRYPITKERT